MTLAYSDERGKPNNNLQHSSALNLDDRCSPWSIIVQLLRRNDPAFFKHKPFFMTIYLQLIYDKHNTILHTYFSLSLFRTF